MMEELVRLGPEFWSNFLYKPKRTMMGAINGLVIVIFNFIYRLTAEWIVNNWENHLYEKEKSNSAIVKNFIFQFCSSYLNLFIWAFYDNNFALIRNTITSMQITHNLSNIFLVNFFLYNFLDKYCSFVNL